MLKQASMTYKSLMTILTTREYIIIQMKTSKNGPLMKKCLQDISASLKTSTSRVKWIKINNQLNNKMFIVHKALLLYRPEWSRLAVKLSNVVHMLTPYKSYLLHLNEAHLGRRRAYHPVITIRHINAALI